MPFAKRLEATLLARGGQFCQWLLKHPCKVRSGIFEGLSGLKNAHHSALLPKLLGTYELELNSTVDELLRLSPSQIINVGAAEGYYTVGLLMRLPSVRAIAFETEQSGRLLLQELARANSVTDRLVIKESATEEALFELLSNSPKSLLIMDIEGAETILLSKRVREVLKNHLAIIELHGEARESLVFKDKVQATPRNINDFPFDKLPSFWKLLPKNLLTHLMNEYRPEIQSWGIIR